jgi:hypothetical protein
MYNINSGLIAFVLFASMVGLIELGFRLGQRKNHTATADSKTHINTIQSAILGILALILGFTFSLSLQRFDSRSEAVAAEANAIGTTYLRAQLLPAPVRADARATLRNYIDLRVQEGKVSLGNTAARQKLLAQAEAGQTALWAYATKAAELDPNPVHTGLFIQSLNDLIDNFGLREAALYRHVPEAVLWLLFLTFLLAGAVVGFSAGVASHRPAFATYLMVLLMTVLVFIILDLDHPRRGFVEVSQKSMLDLQSSVNKEAVK